MELDLQERLETLQAMQSKLAAWERELAKVKKQHQGLAAGFAENQARAALAGGRLQKQPELVCAEKRIAELEILLPPAREVLSRDLHWFKIAVADRLRGKYATALPAAKAKLDEACEKVADAIAALALIIGAEPARGILSYGEHVQPIRERLAARALPDLGLMGQVAEIRNIEGRLLQGPDGDILLLAARHADAWK